MDDLDGTIAGRGFDPSLACAHAGEAPSRGLGERRPRDRKDPPSVNPVCQGGAIGDGFTAPSFTTIDPLFTALLFWFHRARVEVTTSRLRARSNCSERAEPIPHPLGESSPERNSTVRAERVPTLAPRVSRHMPPHERTGNE